MFVQLAFLYVHAKVLSYTTLSQCCFPYLSPSTCLPDYNWGGGKGDKDQGRYQCVGSSRNTHQRCSIYVHIYIVGLSTHLRLIPQDVIEFTLWGRCLYPSCVYPKPALRIVAATTAYPWIRTYWYKAFSMSGTVVPQLTDIERIVAVH